MKRGMDVTRSRAEGPGTKPHETDFFFGRTIAVPISLSAGGCAPNTHADPSLAQPFSTITFRVPRSAGPLAFDSCCCCSWHRPFWPPVAAVEVATRRRPTPTGRRSIPVGRRMRMLEVVTRRRLQPAGRRMRTTGMATRRRPLLNRVAWSQFTSRTGWVTRIQKVGPFRSRSKPWAHLRGQSKLGC